MNKHTAELLEKHFDTAFAAPDGIKKLRELILTLAMQGRLVPQEPNDQPASELLKEIEAEKQRLVQEGEIRSPKPLPPVTAEEEAYVLPRGWEWVRLRDVCHDWGQKTPNGHFTYIDVSAIDNKIGRVVDAQIIDSSDAPSRARKIVHPGTVIYSTVRPYLLNVAIVEREYEPEPIASTAFAILHPYKGILNKFIFQYLRSPIFIGYVENAQKGVAYPAINDGDFFSGLFPLPPSEEQHRIAAKIDELMARSDELETLHAAQQGARLTVHAAAIKQLLNIAEPDQHQRARAFLAEHFGELYTVKENVAELRKAILQLAVTGKLVPQDPNHQPACELLKEIEDEKQRLVQEDKIKKPKPLPPVADEEKPYALPCGWEWVRFGEIFDVSGGIQKTPKRSPSKNHYPYIGVSNVQRGRLDLSELKRFELVDNELEKYRLYPNDLMIVEGNGSEQEIGRCALWGGEVQDCVHQNHLIRCRPYFYDSSVYLLLALNSPFGMEQMRRLAVTTSGLYNLSVGKIRGIYVPLPPILEQRRIVAKTDELMALCNSLEQNVDAATSKQSELLNVLMHVQSQGDIMQESMSAARRGAQVIDLATYRATIGCYAFSKLANAQYFGRTAAAKVMYLAQAHIGLELDLKPEREAAGPLDTWIYDFERQGQGKSWFEVNEKTLASGRKKTEYRCLSALSEPAAKAEALMSSSQKAEFERLIYALADKKTEEVEIIATLFAVWNDFLIDGIQPKDEQIIADMRENWHASKARFTSEELHRWLEWLRKEKFVPSGRSPRTLQQSRLQLT